MTRPAPIRSKPNLSNRPSSGQTRQTKGRPKALRSFTGPAGSERRHHDGTYSGKDRRIDNVLIGTRKTADLYGRVFVVSAYGGVTDKLLEHKKTGEPGVYALFASSDSDWAWGDALSEVGRAMQAINADALKDPGDAKAADDFVRERVEGVRSCLIDLSRLCSFGQFRLEGGHQALPGKACP